jgi:transcriptional regulator with XRE-family HTH domain
VTEQKREKRKYASVGLTGKQVGTNLKRLRELRKISTTELSSRLSEKGVPLQATGITRIESGERRVTVDELVTMAVILGCSPNALLLPPATEGITEITGYGEVTAMKAWRWARGRSRLRDDAEWPFRTFDDEDEAAYWGQLDEEDVRFRSENSRDEPPHKHVIREKQTPEQRGAMEAVAAAMRTAYKDHGLSLKDIIPFGLAAAIHDAGGDDGQG